ESEYPSRPGGGRNRRLARYVECHVMVMAFVAVAALITGVAACGTQAADQPAGPPTAGTGTASPARTVTASPQPAGTGSWHPPGPSPTLTGPVTLTTTDNGLAV